MANIERDPASGNWRIRIYFEKKQYFRSCDTADEETARMILGTVKETIRLLKRERIKGGTEVLKGSNRCLLRGHSVRCEGNQLAADREDSLATLSTVAQRRNPH